MKLIASIVAMSILTITILFGNILVILSVLFCRKLRQNLTSYLILSLAVADVSVGAFILPFSTANSVLGVWIFGELWCRIWLMLDVFLCTASIYNLVAISIDRFFAIVQPMAYANVITPTRVALMIFAVWTVSFLICIPPMIPWSEVENLTTLDKSNLSENDCGCTPLHNSPAYVIFSASGSFYVPMVVIIVIYARIFMTARRVSKSMAKGYVAVGMCKKSSRRNATVAIANDSDTFVHQNSISSPSWKSHFSLASRRQSLANHSPTRTPQPPVDLQQPHTEVLRIHVGRYEKRDSDTMFAYDSLKEIGQTKQQLQPRNSDGALYRPVKWSKSAAKLQCQMVAKNTIVTPSMRNNSLIEEVQAEPIIGASLMLVGGLTPTSTVMNRKVNGSSVLGKMLSRKSAFFSRKLTIEIRAAKTVAIVTGCFIVCWLGFAIVYLLSAFPFCPNSTCVPEGLSGFLFWMGYVNSGLNVIIYALFSKPFRDAFARILCFRKDV